jgi:uncharacterized cupin superfamily protein
MESGNTERGMSVESVSKLGVARLGMTPSPIYGDWILEGTPVARNSVLSSSADGGASTVMWDCTAGRFNWFYGGEETIYVIEGSVIIKDGAGVARRLSAGDTIFFPAGSRAEWHVETYIRKIAFCRTPLPRPLVFAKRGMKFLKRLMGVDGDSGAAIATFQTKVFPSEIGTGLISRSACGYSFGGKLGPIRESQERSETVGRRRADKIQS